MEGHGLRYRHGDTTHPPINRHFIVRREKEKGVEEEGIGDQKKTLISHVFPRKSETVTFMTTR